MVAMTKDSLLETMDTALLEFLSFALCSCRHLHGLYSLLAGQSTLFMEPSGKQKQETPCSKLFRISRWRQHNPEPSGEDISERRTLCTQPLVQGTQP